MVIRRGQGLRLKTPLVLVPAAVGGELKRDPFIGNLSGSCVTK